MSNIVSFCGSCGVLLKRGLGLLSIEDQVCENCGESVSSSEARIEGEFTTDDANRLYIAQGLEDE
jgi:hypothetical protein